MNFDIPMIRKNMQGQKADRLEVKKKDIVVRKQVDMSIINSIAVPKAVPSALYYAMNNN